MAGQGDLKTFRATLADEIDRVKNIYGHCKVIWDSGDYTCILTVTIQDVSIKCMIDNGYPEKEAQIVVRGASLSPAQCEELSSHLKGAREPDIVLLMDIAQQWLQENKSMKSDKNESTPTKKSNEIKHKQYKKHDKRKNKRRNRDSESDEFPDDEKKASMKTAIDVISRIQWDEALEQEYFTIGYVDRFLGIVEKNFTAFSWEDIASVDYNTLAIPKHRIEYFKYKDLIVWEKKSRTDNVFGSTGSNVTILDVIKDYEALQSQQQQQNNDDEQTPKDPDMDKGVKSPDEPNDDDDDDDDDDEFQINVGQLDAETMAEIAAASAAAAADWDANDSQQSLYPKEKYWGPKKRPTHFLCLRITDTDIIESMERAHDEILSLVPEYHDAILPKSRLHITLACLGLDDATEASRAADILHRLQPELMSMQPQDMKVTLQGVGDFYRSVLYAQVHCEQMFLDFVEKLRNMVKAEGIEIRDIYDFTPHVTLVKLRGAKKHELNTPYLDTRLYKLLEDRKFGTQVVDNIWLCEMSESRQYDGFYISQANIQF